MAEKDLKNLTNEELIKMVEELEQDLKNARNMKEFYYNETKRLESKLQIIANTVKL